MSRSITKLFADARKKRERLIGVVAGSGECARSAVEAGADLLMALNAGMYRNLGYASLASYLPFGDANEQTQQLLREHIVPHAGTTPVVAGIFGEANDPGLRAYLEQLKIWGVRAVVCWPASSHYDGTFRDALEAEGLGVEREIETLRWARELGFETGAFAFTPDDARRFADSGVDFLVLNVGLTRGVDDLREKRDRIQQAIGLLRELHKAALSAGRRIPCLAYGGPVTTSEDLEQLFRFCDVDGFAGGSVFERLPLRDVTGATVRRFKSVALSANVEGATGLGEILGRSAPMAGLFQLIQRVAPFDVSVCIEGETGAGKELVAMQLHRLSQRAHQPFVTLNCGALPEGLLESELFGHEKGAFTGADRRRLGKFELAHRGTLFLDEVASLTAHGQVALLRALQQREITRVGGEAPIAVDVRIVAASNVSLEKMVANGVFRIDLYHRLNQITLQVPPLRERGSDLRLLAEGFLRRLEIQLDRRFTDLSPRFWSNLEAHAWPGNVRELQHVLLQSALREDGPILEGAHFSPQKLWGSKDLDATANWQSTVIKVLREHHGNKSRTAAALGVTRKTLYRWLAELEPAKG